MRIQLSDHFTFQKLYRFVTPSVVMMVFVSIYSVVDGLFVANFVGADAVAAINYVMPLVIVIGAVGFMMGAGGSALVAKTLGEGDKARANAYFSMIVYVTAGIGVFFAVVGQFIVPPFAKMVGAEGETYAYCVLYGRILLGSQPLFILQNVFQSFFVTAEKPRLGLAVTAGAGVANMALDALFVAAFRWGLAGAAAATATSQVLGGVFPLLYFFRKNDSLLRLTGTKFYGKALWKSVTNGSSEFFSNVSTAVVIYLYNYQMKQFVAGDDGVAAYGAIGYLIMTFFSVFMGYSVGCAPLIGYHYGAGNREELRNLCKKSLITMGVAGVVMTLLAETCGQFFVGVFGYEGELYDLTLRGLRIYSVAFLVTGFSVFASSMFTALNNGLVSGLISFLRTLVFQVAAVLVVPLFLGLDGVWSAICFAETASLCVASAFFFANGRKYGYL